MKINRKDVLQMQPGSDMNSLIAYEFLGWKDISVDSRGRLTGYCPRRRQFYTVPNFSKKIAAAWSVIELLRIRHFRIRIEEYAPYRSKVTVIDREERTCHSFGETAPEAICKAALMTLIDDGKNELEVSLEQSTHNVQLDRAIASGKVTRINQKRRT